MAALKGKIGDKYGRLVLVERVENRSGKPTYRCRCDCGKESVVTLNAMRQGNTKSCGCLHSEMMRVWAPKMSRKYHALPPGEAGFNGVFESNKAGAKRRGLPFRLTRSQFEEISRKPCWYCGELPSNLAASNGGEVRYNGLDRVDNSKGYVVENVVPACWKCNRGRQSLSQVGFLKWAKRVVDHNRI